MLARIAAGDETAFASFFHQYIGVLKPFVFSFTKSDAAADELIQDIFIRVWLGRDKLTTIEAPKAWLFKIASNECFRYLRKKLVEEKTIAQFTNTQDHSTDTTSDYLNVQEIKNIVAATINALAPQRKRIYIMSREGGMKIDEIAHELNLSPNTVKNVLVTTAKIIRTKLEEAGYYLPFIIISFWIK